MAHAIGVIPSSPSPPIIRNHSMPLTILTAIRMIHARSNATVIAMYTALRDSGDAAIRARRNGIVAMTGTMRTKVAARLMRNRPRSFKLEPTSSCSATRQGFRAGPATVMLPYPTLCSPVAAVVGSFCASHAYPATYSRTSLDGSRSLPACRGMLPCAGYYSRKTPRTPPGQTAR